MYRLTGSLFLRYSSGSSRGCRPTYPARQGRRRSRCRCRPNQTRNRCCSHRHRRRRLISVSVPSSLFSEPSSFFSAPSSLVRGSLHWASVGTAQGSCSDLPSVALSASSLATDDVPDLNLLDVVLRSAGMLSTGVSVVTLPVVLLGVHVPSAGRLLAGLPSANRGTCLTSSVARLTRAHPFSSFAWLPGPVAPSLSVDRRILIVAARLGSLAGIAPEVCSVWWRERPLVPVMTLRRRKISC